MASDNVQTVVVLHPVHYQPLGHTNSQIVEDMANLSFTPPIAIPRPSNLPSNICTISSGVGNFDISGNSSSTPTKYGMDIVRNCQGVPIIGREFSPSTLNTVSANHIPVPNVGVQHHPHAPDHVTYSQYHNGSIFSVPKSWPRDTKDDMVVTVYGLVKTLLGASGTNQGAIDNRIEQAMDLVKSHLMNAVRSEVEELKEKILRLEDTITNLQNENEVLKAYAPTEVLRQISSTPNPQLTIQQQTSSTAYQTATVNQTSQNTLPLATSMAPSGNVTNSNAVNASGSNMNAALLGAPTPQVANPSNAVPAAVPGIISINPTSQIAASYVPQTAGTNVPSANNQAVTPQHPQ